MSHQLILDYIKKHNLYEKMETILHYNTYNFDYLFYDYVPIVEKNSKYYAQLNGLDENNKEIIQEIEMDPPQKYKNKMLAHPEHCQAILYKLGDELSGNIYYSRKNNREGIFEEIIIRFLCFTEINTLDEFKQKFHM